MNSIQVEFLKEFSKLLKKYNIDQVYSDNDPLRYLAKLIVNNIYGKSSQLKIDK